jgi:hypothetical protein
MDWSPPVDAAPGLVDGTPHELVLPAVEPDERHTWVDLDTGVVHIVLPPERFGAAWEPEPRSQPRSEGQA